MNLLPPLYLNDRPHHQAQHKGFLFGYSRDNFIHVSSVLLSLPNPIILSYPPPQTEPCVFTDTVSLINSTFLHDNGFQLMGPHCKGDGCHTSDMLQIRCLHYDSLQLWSSNEINCMVGGHHTMRDCVKESQH